jgi:hypothetical protein
MKDIAALITAIGTVLWPLLFAGLIYVFRKRIGALLESGAEVAFEFMGGKLSVKPTERLRAPSSQTGLSSPEVELDPIDPKGKLPADYLYLNHTSFLREERQAEFQKRTGVPLPHYDIRVILDSYYRGALDRVERVEYILHKAYPDPIQIKVIREEKFLLKELANGEYVLQAKVFLVGEKHPIILQRYISLWKEGPRIGV